MSEISLKQGETLNLSFRFKHDESGQPVDVTHSVITAQVRDAQDMLVAMLPLVKDTEIGLVTLQRYSTATWPPGRLRCDIALAFGGQIVKSETFAIKLGRAVTEP